MIHYCTLQKRNEAQRKKHNLNKIKNRIMYYET